MMGGAYPHGGGLGLGFGVGHDGHIGPPPIQFLSHRRGLFYNIRFSRHISMSGRPACPPRRRYISGSGGVSMYVFLAGGSIVSWDHHRPPTDEGMSNATSVYVF
jgi:hypothetical protein